MDLFGIAATLITYAMELDFFRELISSSLSAVLVLTNEIFAMKFDMKVVQYLYSTV